MAFFDDDQLEALRIEQMVFHLVGPTEEHFVRLEVIEPGRFAGFFLERIGSVNGGAPYVFTDASATRERLGRIAADPRRFQEESEKLAEDFQRQHGGSTAAGAFMVFRLRAGEEEYFALLKYDDEKVLTYDVTDAAGGRKRVSLDSLERTFVQNREALQKSALIRLTDDGGELTVLDRRNQQKVARYFEAFLAAKRLHDDAELSEKLVKVVRDLIRGNKDLVSPEVFREANRRTYDAAAGGGALGIDDQKRFLEAVVGQNLPDGHPLVQKFRNALKRERIEGAPVVLTPEKVRPPALWRYVTRNQIQIRVPDDMLGAIEVEDERIIIHDRLEQQFDEPEGRR
ncbi:nucleoid-associated protein [Ancylobacter mangrovi]|uniref:nucleoid-associated protein n=1 Tax=Ancylobacter mangrovi TaxID=2972472 RepID=UPI0021621E90|nr:nucleoid-associated protein [Ancylobacter mangrovi]MCS0501587.1 nucleoid-associated protein [Ancylobacter mangrovi]